MRKILIFIVLLVATSSCKDYLDLKPYGKVIPKTAEEYSAMIQTILNDIETGDEDYIIANSSEAINDEVVTDNLDANISIGNDILGNYLGGKINNSSNAYMNLYNRINVCNIVIEGIAADDSELAKVMIATSKAIRGVCYYELLRRFCEPVVAGVYPKNGVPLVSEFDMEARPIRSSYENTVKFIEQDFADALKINVQDKKYLFTADVVAGYMARLYFWIGDWTNAAKYADELLRKFPLINGEEYLEMFKTNGLRGNMLFKSQTAVTGAVQENALTSLKYRVVNKTLIDAFDNAQSDIRYKNFISSKRISLKAPAGTMRSAEFALILAESYYHLGKPQEALDEINTLRRNRITPYTNITLATIPVQPVGNKIKVDALGKTLTPLIELILNERRKELFAEDDRLYELKRNGTPPFWISRNGVVYNTLSYMYTYPIPYREIELVKEIEQNPGYDTFE